MILLVLNIVFFIFNTRLSCKEILVVTYQFLLGYSSNSPTMAKINCIHGFANSITFIYYILPFPINFTLNKLFREALINRFFGIFSADLVFKYNRWTTTVGMIGLNARSVNRVESYEMNTYARKIRKTKHDI